MPSLFRNAAYRVFQFCMSRAEYFLSWKGPVLLKGPNAVKKLPAYIKSKGIDKVLVVSGGTTAKLGLLDPMLAACKEAGLDYAWFDHAENNPSIENIEEARKCYVDNGCAGFVAFGGGSPMDCAKAAAARIVRPDQTISALGGTLKVRKRIPPFFAVPTTAGTGSETTIAAVVTDKETHHKYALQDVALMPHCAVLDPVLTVGLPPHTTAATGMDALTHAVEAYTNRMAPRYTAELAEQAVKLIFENLETAYRDGANLTARNNMLLAAFYAGAAFTRACVGNVHAIAHTLGGLYNTPHGLANAVILPYVLEDYGKAVYKKLARLATLVGIPGSDDEEKAKAFIAAIRRMNDGMNIVDKFSFIDEKDIPQMIEWAKREANPVYPVPVIYGDADFRRVIDRIRG